MAFTQADRAMRVATPLGPDKLLLVELNGTETLSELFQFHLTLVAENATKVEFDKLIGGVIAVVIDMPDKKKRFFNGICARLSEGRRDDTLTHYRMEVVPKFWLLTRRVQSRIFQQITVPDILKEVLKGLDVKWEIKGTFFERDYCVQYRESDFAFASRLMEEEGIYYHFTHSADGHTMVVANTPQSHVDVPEFSKAIFDPTQGGNRPDMRVTDWEKVQELRSGKVTLWDHCFELPQQNLEAKKTIQESVAVGKVTHKLKVADNDKLEIYDFPGAYAQRFDGIDPGGGARPDDLKKIFEDNGRVAKLHVEREAVESLVIHGSSNCRQFCAGHKFTLERHFNADGEYVLTAVSHNAKLAAEFRSGQSGSLGYTNSFSCQPLALPFRPQIKTPKPLVGGTQTATVVGPAGEIIFCDKYGRVKVQFHWDRQGKKDAESSCWVRVSQSWGGAGWGGMAIPHVGQEVIVSFEEGDLDRPIVTGRVYNAESMPPLELPANKTKSVVARDHGGNEIILEGQPGKQQMRLYSPTHETTIVMGNSYRFFTSSDKKEETQGSHHEDIGGNASRKVGVDLFETIVGKHKIEVGGDFIQFFAGASMRTYVGLLRTNIGGWKSESILGAETKMIRGAKKEVIKGTVYKEHVGMEYKKEAGNLREKSPNVLRMIKEASFAYKTAKKKIDADETIKVAAKQATEAATIYSKMDEFKAQTSNVYQIEAATMKQKLQEEIIKNAGDTKRTAASISEKASADVKLKGAEIKLN